MNVKYGNIRIKGSRGSVDIRKLERGMRRGNSERRKEEKKKKERRREWNSREK